MMTVPIGAALLLGLLSSFHCIGMCGPIALSLPLSDDGFLSRFNKVAIYNIARMSSYSVMGAVLGVLGAGIAFAGFQQMLSIVAGLIILAGLIYIYLFRKSGVSLTIPGKFVQKGMSRFIGKRSVGSFMMLGFLNGLLPCGMVYVALAASVATASVVAGAGFMAFFGLGTVPAMVFVSLARGFIPLRLRSLINKASPFIIGLMAVMLVLRGMNLGIPYISPQLTQQKGSIEASCCHAHEDNRCHN